MFSAFIANTYAFVFIAILMWLLLYHNTVIEKQVRHAFVCLLILACIQCIVSNVSFYLEQRRLPGNLLSFLSHINYQIKPTLLYLVLLISERDRSVRIKILYGIPLAVLSLLMIISFPTGLVVYYEQPGAYFRHGPLFAATWTILPVYLFAIVHSSLRKGKSSKENTYLLFSSAVICSNIFFELTDNGIFGMEQTVIIIAILSYYLYFQSQQYAELRLEDEKKLANARLQAMSSQIKPHFIYNSLSCIAEVCHEKAPEAEEAVLKFSSYLRNCFRSLEEDGLIPFSREFDMIHSYVELEKLQQVDNLSVIYELAETDFSVPVLSIETLVENAVKHGLRHKRGGGTVLLRTCRKDGNIIIEINDDGVGFDPKEVSADSHHLGLKNARMRLKELCNAEMVVVSSPGAGTSIQIFIPEGSSNEYIDC